MGCCCSQPAPIPDESITRQKFRDAIQKLDTKAVLKLETQLSQMAPTAIFQSLALLHPTLNSAIEAKIEEKTPPLESLQSLNAWQNKLRCTLWLEYFRRNGLPTDTEYIQGYIAEMRQILQSKIK